MADYRGGGFANEPPLTREAFAMLFDSHSLRHGFAIAFAALLLSPALAAPIHVSELYQASVIVTGQGEENRGTGLALCLREVLVKVSGDPTIMDLPQTNALAARAASFVDSFDYRDRMAGIPVHDEQGSRDRPYDLTATFNSAKIDDALLSLGRKSWRADRPTLAVIVLIKTGDVSYILADDGRQGRDQRDALQISADRLGIPIVIPDQSALLHAGVDGAAVAAADPAWTNRLSRALDADAALIGQMTWSDEALGWITQWRLTAQSGSIRWAVRGGSFDHAFRTGVGGAAQILSGNGSPQ